MLIHFTESIFSYKTFIFFFPSNLKVDIDKEEEAMVEISKTPGEHGRDAGILAGLFYFLFPKALNYPNKKPC